MNLNNTNYVLFDVRATSKAFGNLSKALERRGKTTSERADFSKTNTAA